MPWCWAKANAVDTSCAPATESTARGRAPSYRGFWVSRTTSYDEEPGRARVPCTWAARPRQSAAVGPPPTAELRWAGAVDPGETGGAGLACGGDASGDA